MSPWVPRGTIAVIQTSHQVARGASQPLTPQGPRVATFLSVVIIKHLLQTSATCSYVLFIFIIRCLLWFSLSLKHATKFFSLSDHYIVSREWRIIVGQVQTNYHGMAIVF